MSSAPVDAPPPSGASQRPEHGVDERGKFDLPPDQALSAIRSHSGPVFVDLDETLYLRNSTEDFIDTASPRLAALLLLRVLDVLKPWRWTGGAATRDVWRVRAIRLFFPWTMGAWKRRASTLAQEFVNVELRAALLPLTGARYVVTVGFESIVSPLIEALQLPVKQVVAARLSVFSDRQAGKLQLAKQALGEDCIRRALLITDSLDDHALLAACARGIRTVWPQAHYRSAFTDVYLPGQYIALVKHPGEHYIRRSVLQDDYVWWILASIALSVAPIEHVIGLLFLLMSFWTIYEMGYADNDKIADQFEAQPALTSAYHEVSVATPRVQPWIWSSVFGIAGVYVIRWPGAPAPRDFVLWTVGLVGTFLWFALYNRSTKPARVWMYGGLQLSRTAVFALIVPILPVGAMALAAHVLTRWVQYYVYRLMGKNWPMQTFFGITRLMAFLMLGVFLGISTGWSAVLNWTALALVAWSIFRARREFAQVWSQRIRLDLTNTRSRSPQ
jgi:hypothetical protein